MFDKKLEEENKKILEHYEKHLQENKKEILNRIILQSINNLRVPQPIPQCYRQIKLHELKNYSEKTIGKLLGKKGEHKKEFMKLTGVNLEIDKAESGCVFLSKYNPLEIEKAFLLLERLLKFDTWTTESMKKHYDEIVKEIEDKCIADGSKILTQFLKYETFSDNLAKLVGLLKYHFSYSQNLFDHSMEVAQLSGNIAFQLDLNVLKAKRAGFFHDIGKVIANYDDHTVIGANLAEDEKLDKYIQNAIASHHGKVKCNNPYSVIVKAVDKLSAGRIGARPLQMDLMNKRKDLINKSLLEIPWIEKVILKNAGNLIQIFLKLSEFSPVLITQRKQEVKDMLKSIDPNYVFNYQIELKLIYEEIYYMNNQDSENEKNVEIVDSVEKSDIFIKDNSKEKLDFDENLESNSLNNDE